LQEQLTSSARELTNANRQLVSSAEELDLAHEELDAVHSELDLANERVFVLKERQKVTNRRLAEMQRTQDRAQAHAEHVVTFAKKIKLEHREAVASCAICLSELQETMVGTCGHRFCGPCISQAATAYMDNLYEDDDGINIFAAEDTATLLSEVAELCKIDRQLVSCPRSVRGHKSISVPHLMYMHPWHAWHACRCPTCRMPGAFFKLY
jgi:hypothetical protein